MHLQFADGRARQEREPEPERGSKEAGVAGREEERAQAQQWQFKFAVGVGGVLLLQPGQLKLERCQCGRLSTSGISSMTSYIPFSRTFPGAAIHGLLPLSSEPRSLATAFVNKPSCGQSGDPIQRPMMETTCHITSATGSHSALWTCFTFQADLLR